MALDPTISLGVRPPQVNIDVPSPIQQFGQLLSLRQMMESSQAHQLAMQQSRLELQKMQQGMQEQQAIAKLFAGQADAAQGGGVAGGTGFPSVDYGSILRAAPTTGMNVIKAMTEQSKAATEARIKQLEQNAKTAERLGSISSSILAAKDPASAYAPGVMQAVSEGLFTPEAGRQMLAHGYDEDLTRQFANRALGVKDQHDVALTDLKSFGEALTNSGRTIGSVNDQAGYSQWLPNQDVRIQRLYGPMFSPDLKSVIQTSGMTPSEALTAQRAAPEAAMKQAQFDGMVLRAALKNEGPAGLQAALAKLPDNRRAIFAGQTTDEGIRNAALNPEQQLQAAAQTEVADIDVNGKPHKVLVNKRTGEPIKDLGPSGYRPQQVNVNAAANLLDRESARFAKPHESALTAADGQLEKIADARAMINGPAAAQALGIPKVLTALVGGAGSGVRVTQPELNALAKARGITGDVEGFLNTMSGAGSLTATQKQQITQLLDDVAARIRQKRAIASDAIDRINSAGSREEIVAIDKDVRQKLGETAGATAPTAATTNYQIGQTVMYNGAPHKIKDIKNGKLVLEQ